MDNGSTSVTEHLQQLDTARKLVLGDAALYPQIVEGILPIIGANSRLELRRWGAEFLAETFASPTLGQLQKQPLSLLILNMLNAMLDVPAEDTDVLKSVIQTAASVYPLVFKHMYVLTPFTCRRDHMFQAYGSCTPLRGKRGINVHPFMLLPRNTSHVFLGLSLELPIRPTPRLGPP